MVLIKIYPKDTEMYLWSQTSAEGAEGFQLVMDFSFCSAPMV